MEPDRVNEVKVRFVSTAERCECCEDLALNLRGWELQARFEEVRPVLLDFQDYATLRALCNPNCTTSKGNIAFYKLKING